MIENSVISGRIVTLAATLYVARQAHSMSVVVWEAYVDRRIEAIDRLHAEAHAAIKTDFEFWWSGEPARRITARILEGDLLPEDVKQFKDPQDAIVFILEDLQDKARHLAVHAYIGQTEHELIVDLPKYRGARHTMIQQREEHEAELDYSRELLMEADVNIDELEARFASTSL